MPAGNCCCDDCLIVTDDFGDATITDWTQQTGAWSESGGQLTESGGSGVITHDTGATGDNHIVRASITFSAVGQRARIFGNYTGLLDYLYAEIEITSTTAGKLKIGQSATGDFDEVSFAFSGGLPLTATLTLCISSESTIANVAGITQIVWQDATTPGGTNAGLEVVSGNPAFNDFFFFEEDCFPCGVSGVCECCKNSEAPGFLKLTVSGFSGGVGTCGCGDLNGTYICTLQEQFVPCLSGNNCAWEFRQFAETLDDVCGPSPDHPCNSGTTIPTSAKWQVRLGFFNGQFHLTTAIIESNSLGYMLFDKLLGSEQPECNSWDDLELPYKSRSFGAGPQCCTVGTVTVTAI